MSARRILHVWLTFAVFSPQRTGATLIRVPRRLSLLPTVGVTYVCRCPLACDAMLSYKNLSTFLDDHPSSIRPDDENLPFAC